MMQPTTMNICDPTQHLKISLFTIRENSEYQYSK
jgi:hypothetical protein